MTIILHFITPLLQVKNNFYSLIQASLLISPVPFPLTKMQPTTMSVNLCRKMLGLQKIYICNPVNVGLLYWKGPDIGRVRWERRI